MLGIIAPVMQTILSYIQIVLSVILIILILLQQSDSSLGAAFGGGDSESGHRTRRGSEKLIFNATIVTGALFAISAIISLIL